MPATPGVRQAAQVDTALDRVLRMPSLDLRALAAVLQDDSSAAILPLKGGNPVLIVAMRHHCSLGALRMLLAYGAQPEQVDGEGRHAMDALLAMSVPERAQTGSHCPAVARLHVQYAIELLHFGAIASPRGRVGDGNDACATCARNYGDAITAAVLRRCAQPYADKDVCGIVADFVYR